MSRKQDRAWNDEPTTKITIFRMKPSLTQAGPDSTSLSLTSQALLLFASSQFTPNSPPNCKQITSESLAANGVLDRRLEGCLEVDCPSEIQQAGRVRGQGSDADRQHDVRDFHCSLGRDGQGRGHVRRPVRPSETRISGVSIIVQYITNQETLPSKACV